MTQIHPFFKSSFYIFIVLLIGGLITQSTSSQVLVLVHDSTTVTSQAKRQADLDTLRRHLPAFVGTSYTMRKFDTTTTYADLNNFCTIIIQETSFDAITCRWMGLSLRTAVRNWLNGGTPAAKRSLIIIGGDISYNYDRTGSLGIDTSFCRGVLGCSYLVDNGNLTLNNGVYKITGLIKDSVTTSPPGTGFYPDAIRPSWVAPTPFYGHSGRGAADSLSGVARSTANYNVVVFTEDPRYFVGLGGNAPSPNIGFKRVLGELINYVASNGGCVGPPPVGPDYLHYKFENNPTAVLTPNCAAPGVGNGWSPISGSTLTSGGQFDSCLSGTGLTAAGVTTGWNNSLGTSSWTIGMWVDLPTTTFGYLFGDGQGSFRCFNNGAAGTNAITLRGTGITSVDVTGFGSGPVYVHFVYDSAAANIKAYKNGVLSNTVVQTPLNLAAGTGFKVGGYTTVAGFTGKLDEFRLYKRALSAGEILATFNSDLACQQLTAVNGNNSEIPTSF
ncbi:MAG: LamG domain-containing protein, partial [Ignavibacteria bacterium]|nr:LamG domain-containing protein [Ignavibacteria bacterium]